MVLTGSDSIADRMRKEWDDRISQDYRFWMSDGVRTDDEMWQTGERDLQSLLREPPIANTESLVALELGCGVGRLLRPASSLFQEVIGVDVSKEAITRASNLLLDCKNVKLLTGNGTTLEEIADGTIDVAFSFASLCSIPARITASYLRELARVVKQGGEVRLQMYLGEEKLPELQDTLGIRSYQKGNVKKAAELAGFEFLSSYELELPFEANDTQAGIFASVVSLRRRNNAFCGTEEILSALITTTEAEPEIWLGSEAAYHMSLARAEEQLNEGNLEKAKEALELAIRSYSKVEPEVLKLLSELRAMSWSGRKEKTFEIEVAKESRDDVQGFLEANIAAVRRLNPQLAEQLLQEPGYQVSLTANSQGETAIIYAGTPLDNLEKPRKAAELWAERALASERVRGASRILVAGFASGYHLEHLVNRAGKAIDVFEPNVDILRVLFRSRDLTQIVSRLRSLSSQPSEVLQVYNQQELPELVIHPQSQIISRKAFDEVKTVFFAKRGAKELKPNIGVLGPIYGGTLPITHSTARALYGMGQRVRCLDMGPFHKNYFDVEGFVKDRSRKDVLQSYYVEMLSQIVLESLSERPVDILICLAQAPLTTRALTELRNRGVITVMWFVEDSRRFTAWKHLAPFYDYMFCIQDGDTLAQIEAAGAGKAVYLPTACEPSLQRPMTAEEIGDIERWGSELSFVGAGYNNRQQMFASLSNRDFKIWGTEWPKVAPFDRLVQEAGRRLTPEEYIRIFNATKINLNLHSSTERDGVEPNGDFVNPRTFELASCGAFQLIDERRLLPELFDIGKELITFSDFKELEDKADYYLAHPEERIAIAQRARSRALADHTYENRLEQMLGHIYADRYEDLRSRAQSDPWVKTLSAANKYPDLHKRLEKLYARGDEASMACVIGDIQTEKGKLSEEELKLLFLWHVHQSVETTNKTRAGRG